MTNGFRTGVIITAVLFILVIILWLPFGLNVGFQMDGWSFFDKLNTARLVGVAAPAPASRPALNLAWLAAYAIDPDSYVGPNTVMIILLIGKGLLCAAILYNLTQRRVLAFAFGALTILLPADTAVFYLGALTLHLALFFWLLATYCLLLFYETRRLSVAMLVILSLLIGTLAYEIVFMVVPVGLLALLAKSWRINRRFLTAAALYLIVPVIIAIRYAILWFGNAEGVNYQNSLIDWSVTVGDMVSSLARAVGNHFVGGWFGEGIVAYVPYALTAGLIVGAVVWWLQKQDTKFTVSPTTSIPPGWLIAVGLLMIVLGVALYLPTVERNSTVRTYYFSSPGAALVLAVVGWEIARRLRREVVFSVFAGALALLGCWRLLEDHAFYRDRAVAQQRILRQIIDIVPRPQDNVALLVIDEGDQPTLNARFTSSLFLRGSLSLIYDTAYLAVGICDLTMAEDDPDACHFEPGQVEVLLDGGVYAAATYDRLIVLRYSETGMELLESLEGYVDTPAPYDPAALIIEGDPPPRAATMLGD